MAGPLPGVTVSAVARQARLQLAAAGVETPEIDARILVGHALGLSRAGLIAEASRPVSDTEADAIARFVARRAGGEPVGRILGRREFWGLDFALGPDTLEPRPDTETVVEAALDAVRGKSEPLRILDLGTGTGCLLIALLSELPDAWGLGVDISAGAVRTARSNAAALGVAARAAFAVTDWTRCLASAGSNQGFGLIVANPPYISTRDCRSLQHEVAGWDPDRALDGGADGLDAYRAIFSDLGRLLTANGVAVVEIGRDQTAAIKGLAADHRLICRSVRRDLAGIDRALVFAPAR